jgi:hypothetical protein
VVFLGFSEIRTSALAAGLEFHECASGAYSRPSAPIVLKQLSWMSGTDAIRCLVESLVAHSQVAREHAPAALRSCAADALVIDTVTSGMDLVALRMEIPYVHISTHIPVDFSGLTPPTFFDWPHEKGPAAVGELLAPLSKVAAEFAAGAGLELNQQDPYATISKRAWVTTLPQPFDFSSAGWPAQFHYSGPRSHPAAGNPDSFPWERLTGEPLIYASMGTLHNGSEDIFRTIDEASHSGSNGPRGSLLSNERPADGHAHRRKPRPRACC